MATAIDLPARADVVIVGGGFAGCATAWALAERGVRSVILEREAELGRHATGRGAGLGRQLGDDDATTVLSIRGAHLLRSRFPMVWSQSGGLLAFDDRQRAAEYLARAKRLDVLYVEVDRSMVHSHWPTFTGLPIEAVLHVPTDGVIDLRTLLTLFAAKAEVVYQAPAVRISDGRIETPRGVIEARVVVDASGAWAGEAIGDPPLVTHKRHLFVLQANSQVGAPYLWHIGADELYARAEGKYMLVSPCDAVATTPGEQYPTPDGEARLTARLRNVPLLVGADILRRWACQRAFTPDRRIRVGHDPKRPWLVWAAGLGGHGATTAAAVGEYAAAEVITALG